VCIVSGRLITTARRSEVREIAATKTVTIRLPEEDFDTLEKLAERGHSYPATVARRLLSEIMERTRREWESATVQQTEDRR
jgi:predicted transcriptional regulator